jgi:hypothetical protein
MAWRIRTGGGRVGVDIIPGRPLRMGEQICISSRRQPRPWIEDERNDWRQRLRRENLSTRDRVRAYSDYRRGLTDGP